MEDKPKRKNKRYSDVELGFIGECWVQYKLATMNMKTINMPVGFDYDLLTSNQTRIEVKTSVIRTAYRKKRGKRYPRELWQFLNVKRKWNWGTYHPEGKTLSYEYLRRDRECDFFVLVCMDRNYEIVKSYVFPKKVIGDKQMVCVGAKGQGKLEEYKDRWSLIETFDKRPIIV